MLPSRSRTILLTVVALVASAVLAVAPASSAGAASDQGIVRGDIIGKGASKVDVLWFDQSWNYLGHKVTRDSYSLTLPAGTYRLQLVDQRPSYDVHKYAPTDITITVRANALTSRNVRLQKGAFITGTVRNGQKKPAAGARVVAANRAENSFTTTANKKGQFAVGGLPRGTYSVFTWDRKKRWVAKSTYAGSVRPGRGKDVTIRLTKPAGSMTAYLFTPSGLLSGTTSVTVTSKATGQWWTATAKHGTASFRGLYPGRYRLKFDGLGVWLPTTLTVAKANVHPKRSTYGSVRLTKRGGWVTGTVVDNAEAATPPRGIADVSVRLQTSSGNELATTTTDANGNFDLSGPLTTSSGLTIVVTPQNGADSWGQGQQWCMFTTGSRSSVSVTTGKQTAVGQVSLPRSTAEGQPDRCRVS